MPPVTRRMVYDRFHNLLEYLFSLIPTLPSSLYPLLVRNFPHKRQERVDQETYIRNLLRITEYCPALTDRIIGIIIDRMIQIDVSGFISPHSKFQLRHSCPGRNPGRNRGIGEQT